MLSWLATERQRPCVDGQADYEVHLQPEMHLPSDHSLIILHYPDGLLFHCSRIAEPRAGEESCLSLEYLGPGTKHTLPYP